MKPYETIQELLEDSKIHGPYLIPINITPKTLIYPIEINDNGVIIHSGHCGYGEVYSELVTYKSLELNYTWQDGSPCGKNEN